MLEKAGVSWGKAGVSGKEWRFSDEEWHFSRKEWHFRFQFSREFNAKMALFGGKVPLFFPKVAL